MNIKKIVLLALAAVMAALGVGAIGTIGGTSEYLESAVYLESPVLLPENEGKLVIISGTVEMTAPAYDDEYRITIQSPNAVRYTEKYTSMTVERDDDEEEGGIEYEWDWRPYGAYVDLMGGAKLGEFELDSEVVKHFPNATDYDAFDSKEVSRYSVYTELGGITHVVVTGITYAPKTTNHRIGYEYEGSVAVHYRCLDLSKNGEMTLVGIQQDGKLVHGENKAATVNAGIKTKEELIQGSKNTMMIGAGIEFAIAAICLFFALKPAKNEQKKA